MRQLDRRIQVAVAGVVDGTEVERDGVGGGSFAVKATAGIEAQPSIGKVDSENMALVSYRLAPAIRVIVALGKRTPSSVSMDAEITAVPPTMITVLGSRRCSSVADGAGMGVGGQDDDWRGVAAGSGSDSQRVGIVGGHRDVDHGDAGPGWDGSRVGLVATGDPDRREQHDECDSPRQIAAPHREREG